MGMLDYLQENWRDIYRPFQRYPAIYGEHARQGMDMLREDAPGAWDIAMKVKGGWRWGTKGKIHKTRQKAIQR